MEDGYVAEADTVIKERIRRDTKPHLMVRFRYYTGTVFCRVQSEVWVDGNLALDAYSF